jgi:hypothetical protein
VQEAYFHDQLTIRHDYIHLRVTPTLLESLINNK